MSCSCAELGSNSPFVWDLDDFYMWDHVIWKQIVLCLQNLDLYFFFLSNCMVQLYFFCLFLLFKKGSPCVSHTELKLMILLPQSPECWGYSCGTLFSGGDTPLPSSDESNSGYPWGPWSGLLLSLGEGWYQTIPEIPAKLHLVSCDGVPAALNFREC